MQKKSRKVYFKTHEKMLYCLDNIIKLQNIEGKKKEKRLN